MDELTFAPVSTVRITNLRGESGTLEFSPLTVIVGPNRAHKTVWLEGVRLAITGLHPTMKNNLRNRHMLVNLVPKDANVLAASIVTSEGSASFAADIMGDKVTDIRHRIDGSFAMLPSDELQNLFPVTSMRDVVGLGSVLAREAIFRRFGHLEELPCPPAMDAAQRVVWNEADAATAHSGDAADRLAAITEHLRRRKLEAAKQLKSKASAVDKLRAAIIDGAAGAEMLPVLEAQLDSARSSLRAEQTRSKIAGLESRVAQLRGQPEPEDVPAPELQPLRDAVSRAAENVAGHQSKLDVGQQLLGAIDAAVKLGFSCCPVCKGAADLGALARDVAAKVAARDAQLRESIKALNLAKQTLTKAASAKPKPPSPHAEIVQLEAQIAGLYQSIPPEYDGTPVEELQTRIKQIKDSDAARQSLDGEATELRELETRHKLVSGLERASIGLLQTLLQQTKQNAEIAINEWMPEGFRAELNVEGRTCAWRVVGIDGRPHDVHTMAGSEKAALSLALMLSWCCAQGRYLLIEAEQDLAPFDTANMAAALRRLAEMQRQGTVTQVIVAAPDWFDAQSARDAGYNVIVLGDSAPAYVEPQLESPQAETEPARNPRRDVLKPNGNAANVTNGGPAFAEL